MHRQNNSSSNLDKIHLNFMFVCVCSVYFVFYIYFENVSIYYYCKYKRTILNKIFNVKPHIMLENVNNTSATSFIYVRTTGKVLHIFPILNKRKGNTKIYIFFHHLGELHVILLDSHLFYK